MIWDTDKNIQSKDELVAFLHGHGFRMEAAMVQDGYAMIDFIAAFYLSDIHELITAQAESMDLPYLDSCELRWENVPAPSVAQPNRALCPDATMWLVLQLLRAVTGRSDLALCVTASGLIYCRFHCLNAGGARVLAAGLLSLQVTDDKAKFEKDLREWWSRYQTEWKLQ